MISKSRYKNACVLIDFFSVHTTSLENNGFLGSIYEHEAFHETIYSVISLTPL